MLFACGECRRQYDVGQMAPGSKFLCRCGLYVRVPRVAVKDAVVTRCPSCGATLERGAGGCRYCGSAFSIAEIALGEACPQCFSRMFRDAKFCSTCGVKLDAERIRPARLSGPCPRCEEHLLVDRRVEAGVIDECTKCSGMWVGETLFDRIVSEKDVQAMESFTAPVPDAPEAPLDPAVRDVRYLACPECGERMNRKNFGRRSGIILDWCRGHGYWFDPFELERAFAFVRRGGLDQARKAEIEAMERRIRDLDVERRTKEGLRETGRLNQGGGFGLGDFLSNLGFWI